MPRDTRRGPANLVAPDRRIKPHLAPGEALLARRTEGALTSVHGAGLLSGGVRVSIYLTSKRLIFFGTEGEPGGDMTVDLRDVTELSLAGQRLLISLGHVSPERARGLMLDLESSVDFRAQMALAISALRSG